MKTRYLEYIKRMREAGIERNERLQRAWRQKPAALRGPEPRVMPGARAVIDAFLYTVTGEASYADGAVRLLADHDYALYDYIQAYREVAASPP